MNNFRYFIFSVDQLKRDREIADKMNRVYKPKFVVFNGEKYQYTEMSISKENIRFSDYKIVAYGDIENMCYGEMGNF